MQYDQAVMAKTCVKRIHFTMCALSRPIWGAFLRVPVCERRILIFMIQQYHFRRYIVRCKSSTWLACKSREYPRSFHGGASWKKIQEWILTRKDCVRTKRILIDPIEIESIAVKDPAELCRHISQRLIFMVRSSAKRMEPLVSRFCSRMCSCATWEIVFVY